MTAFLLNYNTAFAANSTSPGETFNYLFFSKCFEGSDKTFASSISASGKYKLVCTLLSLNCQSLTS